jgi:hypothetical protein
MARSMQGDGGQQAQPAQQTQQSGQGGPSGPPPLPQQTQWYLGVGGQQQGPFDTGALQAQAEAGTLTPTTLVWRSGMPSWTPAQDVPEVAAVLGAAPPPLPPQ